MSGNGKKPESISIVLNRSSPHSSHSSLISTIVCADNGDGSTSTLFTGSRDGTCLGYTVSSGVNQHHFNPNNNGNNSSAINSRKPPRRSSGDSYYNKSNYYNGNGNHGHNIPIDPDPYPDTTFVGHTDWVNSLCLVGEPRFTSNNNNNNNNNLSKNKNNKNIDRSHTRKNNGDNNSNGNSNGGIFTTHTIATGSSDGTVRLWTTERGGREIACYQAHDDYCTAVASPAHMSSSSMGSSFCDFASTGLDGTVVLWDASVGRSIAEFGPKSSLTAVRENHHYNSASARERLKRRRRKSRISSYSSSSSSFSRGNGSSRSTPSFTASNDDDGDGVGGGSGENIDSLSSSSSSSSIGAHSHHTRDLRDGSHHFHRKFSSYCLSLSSDLIAQGTTSNDVRLYDPRSFHRKHFGRLRGHTENLKSVVVGYDSRRLASSSSDGTVRIWDLRVMKCLLTLEPHGFDCGTGSRSLASRGAGNVSHVSSPIFALDADQSVDRIVSGGKDGRVCVTDIATAETKVIARLGPCALCLADGWGMALDGRDQNRNHATTTNTTTAAARSRNRSHDDDDDDHGDDNADDDNEYNDGGYFGGQGGYTKRRHPSEGCECAPRRRSRRGPSSTSWDGFLKSERDVEYDAHVLAVSFSPDGRSVWASGTDGLVTRWSIPGVSKHHGEGVLTRRPSYAMSPSPAKGTLPPDLPSLSRPSSSSSTASASSRASIGSRRSSTSTISADIGGWRSPPYAVIRTRPRIVKHRVLHNRREILTEDAAGMVTLWDILQGKPIREFLPKMARHKSRRRENNSRHNSGEDSNHNNNDNDKNNIKDENSFFDECLGAINEEISVPQWFTSDIRLGRVSVNLAFPRCLAAEVYANDAGYSDEYAQIKVNLGERLIKSVFGISNDPNDRSRSDRRGRNYDNGSDGDDGDYNNNDNNNSHNINNNSSDVEDESDDDGLPTAPRLPAVTDIFQCESRIRRSCVPRGGGLIDPRSMGTPPWVETVVVRGASGSTAAFPEQRKFSFVLTPARQDVLTAFLSQYGNSDRKILNMDINNSCEELPSLRQKKLSAGRLLRVSTMAKHIIDKLQLECESEEIKIFCRGDLLPPKFTLETIKNFRWKKPQDIELNYIFVSSSKHNL